MHLKEECTVYDVTLEQSVCVCLCVLPDLREQDERSVMFSAASMMAGDQILTMVDTGSFK